MVNATTLLERAEKAFSENDLLFDEEGGVTTSYTKLADQLIARIPAPILANGMNGVRMALRPV